MNKHPSQIVTHRYTDVKYGKKIAFSPRNHENRMVNSSKNIEELNEADSVDIRKINIDI